MIDGAASLMAMFFSLQDVGAFSNQRGSNMLDSGAHFYDTYETSDGKYISIGSIEPQFYALLLEKAGLDHDEFSAQMDRSRWPEYKERITGVFKTKTRDEWCAIMEGSDVFFSPVLNMTEAAQHPHIKARRSFIELDGMVQPVPAPRFSRSEATLPHGMGGELPGKIPKQYCRKLALVPMI